MPLQFAQSRFIRRPIHKGKWDLAIEINENKPFGFDFKNTPFGKDHFDLIPFGGTIKYEDIFTGMIFFRPHSEMKEVTHPYQRYAILQSIKAKNIDMEDPQNAYYLYYSQNLNDEAHSAKFANMSFAWFIYLSNFIPIVVYILLSFISLSGILSYFIILTIRCTVNSANGNKMMKHKQEI